MGVEVGARENENVGGLASQAGKIYNFGRALPFDLPRPND
jgi:hypothetical protein